MDILLMHKDIPVMKINFEDGKYEILNLQNMPYQLRGRIHSIPEITNQSTRYEITQSVIAMNKNYGAVLNYLAARVLPITREHAKKIYSLFGYEQLQDDHSKAKIAIACRAVSLQDDFWIKNENDPIKWENVNLRTNSLSGIVAQVALHGSSLSLQGKVTTPELTNMGAYAKAWIREEDGLYLHKRGTNGNNYESQLEVMVSNLLDKCNVPHIKYLNGESEGFYTCKCKCMTTEELSMLPGLDFISYCNTNGLNPDKEMMQIDAEMIHKMAIVDYLTSNRDRHGLNWGFYYNTNTMEIIGCHPLFDHNNAFDEALMKNRDAEYLFNRNVTMKQAAEIAMKRIDFHFTQEIVREDFMTQEQYESFTSRAKELGIRIEKAYSQIDKIVNNNKLSTSDKIKGLEYFETNHCEDIKKYAQDKIHDIQQELEKEKPNHLQEL